MVYGCAHALFATLLTLAAKTGEILITGGTLLFRIHRDPQILVVGVIVGHMRDKYRRKNGDLEDEKNITRANL